MYKGGLFLGFASSTSSSVFFGVGFPGVCLGVQLKLLISGESVGSRRELLEGQKKKPRQELSFSDWSSKPREFHPEFLTEPNVKVSLHSALVIQSLE